MVVCGPAASGAKSWHGRQGSLHQALEADAPVRRNVHGRDARDGGSSPVLAVARMGCFHADLDRHSLALAMLELP